MNQFKLYKHLILFLLLSSSIAGCKNKQKQPNIIFIMSDDHAAKAISIYDSTLIHTPNIDKIANEGAKLNNCFCTNAICAPSRATLLTGKYSHLNGVMDNKTPFDTSQTTFTKVLMENGYQTALIGKLHLKTHPSGFHYWNILPGQGKYVNPYFIDMGDTIQHQGYVTDLITDFSIDWMEKRDKNKPFCILIHHKASHTPNRPPEKYKTLHHNKKIPIPDNFYDKYENRSSAVKIQRIEFTPERKPFPYHSRGVPDSVPDEKFAATKYQIVMQDYLSVIKSLDDNIGRVLDYLDKENLAENTIVVYTSDQGFFIGEHGWFNKRFMYEESIRMPFVIKYPEKIPSGTIINDMVVNIDFAPTFLDFANVNIPKEMQGVSYKKLLENPEIDHEWRNSMYYHYYDLVKFGNIQKHHGIRTKDYKLIHYYEKIDEWELFDLKADPQEMKSVYGNPDYKNIQVNLKRELNELIQYYNDTTVSHLD